MPTIRQFQAPDDNLQANGLGSSALEQEARINRIDANEAGAAVGGGISALGAPAQQAYDQLVQQPEISRLTSQAAVGMLALTRQYNATINSSDPNDTTVTQKFFDETLDPYLSKLADQATTPAGRDYVQKYSDTLRSHFGTQAAADQVSRAGTAAVGNYQTGTNSWSLAANADPTVAPVALQQADADVKATVDALNLDPQQAAEMTAKLTQSRKAAISLSAIEGMARNNPTQFSQDLDAGKHDDLMANLDPSQQSAARAYAKDQVKADEAAQKAQLTIQAKQDKQAADQAQLKLLGSGVPQSDGSMLYTPDQIKSIFQPGGYGTMPGVTGPEARALRESMIASNERIAKGVTTRTDPLLYQDFQERTFLPAENPRALKPSEVAQAVIDNKISNADAQKFYTGIKDRDPTKAADEKLYSSFIAGPAKQLVLGSYTNNAAPDYVGGQNWYQFQQDFRRTYEAGLAQGKTAAQLLTPGSKDYILLNFPVKKYQFSADVPQDYSNPSVIPPVQGVANPNESLTDFLGNDYSQFMPPSTYQEAAHVKERVPVRNPGESIADFLKRTGG